MVVDVVIDIVVIVVVIDDVAFCRYLFVVSVVFVVLSDLQISPVSSGGGGGGGLFSYLLLFSPFIPFHPLSEYR